METGMFNHFFFEVVRAYGNRLIIAKLPFFTVDELSDLQLNMLDSNTVPGLLPLHVMEQDGQIKLAYEIGTKKSLSHFLRERKISIEDFYSLFISALTIIEQSELYMLREEQFALNENLVFIEGGFTHVHLAYLPVQVLPGKSQLQSELQRLAVYLIGYLDDFRGSGIRTFFQELQSEANSAGELKLRLIELRTEMMAAWTEKSSIPSLPGPANREMKWIIFWKFTLDALAAVFNLLKKFVFEWFPLEKASSYVRLRSDHPHSQLQDAGQTSWLPPADATVLLSNVHYLQPPASKKAWIEVQRGESMERIPVEKDSFIIGRGPVGVDYEDRTLGVSRFHAEITKLDSAFAIKDLGTTNHTFLNGAKLVPFQTYPLNNDDIILIIRTKYIFQQMECEASDDSHAAAV